MPAALAPFDPRLAAPELNSRGIAKRKRPPAEAASHGVDSDRIFEVRFGRETFDRILNHHLKDVHAFVRF